jgi:Rad3-related DNA helicase
MESLILECLKCKIRVRVGDLLGLAFHLDGNVCDNCFRAFQLVESSEDEANQIDPEIKHRLGRREEPERLPMKETQKRVRLQYEDDGETRNFCADNDNYPKVVNKYARNAQSSEQPPVMSLRNLTVIKSQYPSFPDNKDPFESFKFPFKPSEIHEYFMQNIGEGLGKDWKTMAIEVPYGMEKTPIIIRSWLAAQSKCSTPSRILYFTRTEAQVNRVIQECKATPGEFEVTVEASRSRLCAHPEVKTISDDSQAKSACKALRESSKCEYFENLKKMSPGSVNSKIIDIEDLSEIAGRKVCSYYFSKNREQSSSEVTVLSDPYLLKRLNSRKSPLRDNIVVIDDARSFFEEFRECFRLSLASESFIRAIEGMEAVADRSRFKEQILSEVDKVKAILKQILIMENSKNEVYNGDHLRNCIMKDFDKVDTALVYEELHQCKSLATSKFQNIEGIKPGSEGDGYDHQMTQNQICKGKQSISEGMIGSVKHICILIDTLHFFRNFADDQYDKFKFKRSSTSFRIKCHKAEICLKLMLFQKPKAVVFLTESLNTFRNLEPRLCSEIDKNRQPTTNQNKGFYSNKFVSFIVETITESGIKKPLNLDDQSLKDTTTLRSVYRYIFKLMATVSVGVIIVYLPSYSVLTGFQNIWQKEGFLKESLDSIIFEDGEELGKSRIDSFGKACETRRGVIFCVIDSEFAEEVAAIPIIRLLIIIGVPYSGFLSDWAEAMKNKNVTRRTVELLNYKSMSAVNKTFVRMMTTSDDWGAVVYLDERFAKIRLKKYMLPCIMSSLQEHTSDKDLFKRLQDFNRRNSPQIL